MGRGRFEGRDRGGGRGGIWRCGVVRRRKERRGKEEGWKGDYRRGGGQGVKEDKWGKRGEGGRGWWGGGEMGGWEGRGVETQV